MILNSSVKRPHDLKSIVKGCNIDRLPYYQLLKPTSEFLINFGCNLISCKGSFTQDIGKIPQRTINFRWPEIIPLLQKSWDF